MVLLRVLAWLTHPTLHRIHASMHSLAYHVVDAHYSKESGIRQTDGCGSRDAGTHAAAWMAWARPPGIAKPSRHDPCRILGVTASQYCLLGWPDAAAFRPSTRLTLQGGDTQAQARNRVTDTAVRCHGSTDRARQPGRCGEGKGDRHGADADRLGCMTLGYGSGRPAPSLFSCSDRS